MDYAELSRRIEARFFAEPSDEAPSPEALSPKRRAHSRSVADLAAELCARSGLDPERGRAAGLAHDMCKEMPKPRLAELAASYSATAGRSALLGDKVMHGPAAAFLLKRDYGVDDGEFLDAVAYHTLGRIGMGTFETILYCSDKLEPGRRDVDPVFRSRCTALPPDQMLPEVVARVVLWLEAERLPVAPETCELLESLSRRIPKV